MQINTCTGIQRESLQYIFPPFFLFYFNFGGFKLMSYQSFWLQKCRPHTESWRWWNASSGPQCNCSAGCNLESWLSAHASPSPWRYGCWAIVIGWRLSQCPPAALAVISISANIKKKMINFLKARLGDCANSMGMRVWSQQRQWSHPGH
jgi:hypothetical protein